MMGLHFIQILPIGLPVIGDGDIGIEGIAILAQQIQVLGVYRGRGYAAVADDLRGKALPKPQRILGVVEYDGVRVAMDINEARRHDLPRRVDDTACRSVDPADLDDLIALDGHIRKVGRGVLSVDDLPVLDQNVIHAEASPSQFIRRICRPANTAVKKRHSAGVYGILGNQAVDQSCRAASV